MSEPGGSRDSSMPQRRNCRQSNIGLTRAAFDGNALGRRTLQDAERHLAEALGVGQAAAHHAADHALPDVRLEARCKSAPARPRQFPGSNSSGKITRPLVTGE